MRYRAVVVDTNVVVAGLLTGNPEAPTARILDAMLQARLRFLVSTPLLAEHREVLLRPRIRDRHGLGEEEVDRILESLAANAIVRESERAPELENAGVAAPSKNDQHLWDLLAAEPGSILVTGDRALLASPPGPDRVVSPSDLVDAVIG
jgi:putative PIN family toxin of toxin-antitoxin system